MRLSDFEERMAAEFRRRLEPELGERLLALKVFGSRARGTALPSSDMDVLVLLDCYDRPTRRFVGRTAQDVSEAFDFAILISPLVMDVEEFERLKGHERRLALDIEAEGIPV